MRNQTLTEYEERADKYILGKFASMEDTQEKDHVNDIIGKINSEFTKVLDSIAVESNSSYISSIWNSIHIVNFLLTLYALSTGGHSKS